jgi:hypothetical protein
MPTLHYEGYFAARNSRLKYRFLVFEDEIIGLSFKRVDENIFRIFDTDDSGEIPLDPRLSVTNSDGNVVPKVEESYFITWHQTYEIKFNDRTIMRLEHRREQEIHDNFVRCTLQIVGEKEEGNKEVYGAGRSYPDEGKRNELIDSSLLQQNRERVYPNSLSLYVSDEEEDGY